MTWRRSSCLELLQKCRLWEELHFSNKPAFLCLLWENPQTPQRHWSLAGQGHRVSPRRPGCRNQGRESCLHWSLWRPGRGGGTRRGKVAERQRQSFGAFREDGDRDGGELTGGRPPCDCGRSHWRGAVVHRVRRGVRKYWGTDERLVFS